MKKQEKNGEPLLFADEQFKPAYYYEYRQSKKGYVDVIDPETGEFMFRDDTSAAAKEFISQHQIGG